MQQPHERVASHVACYSLNLQGLRTPEQVASVVAWAEESRYDVFFFQETHLTTAPFDFVKQQRGAELLWAGQQWYVPGTGRARGCWVLVKRKACLTHLACVDQTRVDGARGRVLRVDGMMDSHPASLVCVYAPTDSAKRTAFFKTTLPACLPAAGSRQVLLGGDLNAVTHASDYVGLREAVGKRRALKPDAKALTQFERDSGLVDVWRQRQPHTTARTHLSAATRSGARLDRWLLSCPEWVLEAGIVHTRPKQTDHLAVTLRLSIPDAVCMGPGLRRIDPASFDAPDVEAAVQAVIAQASDRSQQGPGHPADDPTYHRGNWHRLKMEAFAVVHASERAARAATAARLRVMEQAASQASAQLEALARDPDASDAQVQQAAQQARALGGAPATHHHRLVSDRLLAGAVLAHTQLNTSSFYQFNKPGREPRPPTHIRSLVVAEGVPALDLTSRADTAAAVEAFASHYSAASPHGVFAARAVDEEARERLLAAGTPRLAAEVAAAAEGPDESGLITVDDLYRALWTSARHKAPGPDGLALEFYLKYWDLGLGVLLKAALDEAFHDLRPGQCPLEAFLLGIITLVAKPNKPKDRIKGYRPITLLDVDTRLLAKALATRLQIPLDLAISITQSAFIAGRDITDNVHYHLALADLLRDRQPAVWLLLMDLAGAYDNVHWGLLEAAMQAIGLRDAGHVRWAQLLHRGAQLRVAVNGHMSQPFPMASGLLQGSGASPVYWTIVLQPLSAYLASLAAGGRAPTPVIPQARLAQGPVVEAPAPPENSYADDMNAAVLQAAVEAALLDVGAGGELEAPEAAAPALEAGAPAPGGAHSQGAGAVLEAYDLFHGSGGPALSLGEGGKCESVLAGVGVEAADGPPSVPGFKSRDPSDPLRLLGVPFAPAASTLALATAAYKGRAQTIRETGKMWLTLPHALWGRVVVAMQCLASKPIFQLAFFAAPKAALNEMQAAVRGYVSTSSDPRDAAPAGGKVYPCEAALAMPPHEGGLGYPVLATFQTALLAKLVASLVGPRSRAWQGMVRRSLQDSVLGMASWVVTRPTAVKLPPGMKRLQACVTAFASLGVARIVLPAEQGFHSIMAEPLFWNPAIGVDQRAEVAGHADAAVRAWRYLRDVYFTLHTGPRPISPAVQATLDTLLPALPEAWRQALQAFPPPASEWECALVPAGALVGVARAVYVARRAADAEAVHWVLDTGRLVQLLPGHRPPVGGGVVPVADLEWQPAQVVRLPAIDQRLTTQEWMDQRLPPVDRPARPEEAWLVGPWQHVWLDSEVWGLPRGQHPIPLAAYSVKHARSSITAAAWTASKRQQNTGGAPYSPGLGIWPKLWGARPWHLPDGQPTQWDNQGVTALEQQWAERYAAVLTHEQQRRDLQAGGRPAGERDAAVMRRDMQLGQPRGPGRPAPRQRGGSPPPAAPPAPPAGGRALRATSIWARNRGLPLPHAHRTVAWRVLHGVLMVHALRLRLGAAIAIDHVQSVDGCCRACLAAGRGRQLETLTHAFITCPAVAPALTWLRAVVQVLLGEAPPLDPLVLLADAHWRWQHAENPLWGALRVSYLGAVWHVRESQAPHPGPLAIINEVVATVRYSITRDASRIDDVELGAGGPPIPAVWFRGPDPKLDQDEFDALWPNSGGWYELQAGAVPVHVRLTAEWPVPFPVPAHAQPPPAAPPDQAMVWVNPEEIPLEGLEEDD
jgi:exonuclease III